MPVRQIRNLGGGPRLAGDLLSPVLASAFEHWDVSDAASVTTASGKVLAVAGKNGNPLVQSNDTLRPTLETINGLDALSFNGGQLVSVETAADWVFLSEQAFEIVLVGRFGNVANPDTIYRVLSNLSSTNGIRLEYDDRTTSFGLNQRWRTTVSSAGALVVSDTSNASEPLPVNEITVLNVSIDPSKTNFERSDLYVDNALKLNGNSQSNAPTAGQAPDFKLTLGSNSDTGPSSALVGAIGELVIYDRQLTTEERDVLVPSLISKWGIS